MGICDAACLSSEGKGTSSHGVAKRAQDNAGRRRTRRELPVPMEIGDDPPAAGVSMLVDVRVRGELSSASTDPS
jgi:hypothetical protein